MKIVSIREPALEDEYLFLASMQRSQSFHYPWIKAPLTAEEFQDYIIRFQQPNQKSYLVIDEQGNIAGVFNISEIIRGSFQSAYLGFYSVFDFAAQGYMSAGLKCVLEKIFRELQLHRIEANIQPENLNSINLVQRHGFIKEGFSPRYLQINGQWRDHERWALTVEDWAKNQ